MSEEHRAGEDAEPVLSVTWGAASDPGRRRAENQDALLTRPPVFLVADGMGGHRDGRLASQEVVRAFEETVTSSWLTSEVVESAMSRAFELVRALGGQGQERAAGSTVSGVGLCRQHGTPSWLVFNLGDSRTYLRQQDGLEQVTVDHSQVQELLDRGLSDVEAHAQASPHVITRAIGGGIALVLHPDLWLVPAQAGDRILICSDGLSNELDPERLGELLSIDDPQAAAEALVAAAVEAGGRDNVTAVVVHAVQVAGERAALPPDPAWQRDDTVPIDLELAATAEPTSVRASASASTQEEPR